MPGQRRKGKKLVTFWEYETNVSKLQDYADKKGVSLSDLIKELSHKLMEETGDEPEIDE
tara:strand:+ start:1772 stop:1948 length:177 start_codon:yes stop_codon:yes gene_type:complete